jgi:hypothetical protein
LGGSIGELALIAAGMTPIGLELICVTPIGKAVAIGADKGAMYPSIPPLLSSLV